MSCSKDSVLPPESSSEVEPGTPIGLSPQALLVLGRSPHFEDCSVGGSDAGREGGYVEGSFAAVEWWLQVQFPAGCTVKSPRETGPLPSPYILSAGLDKANILATQSVVRGPVARIIQELVINAEPRAPSQTCGSTSAC